MTATIVGDSSYHDYSKGSCPNGTDHYPKGSVTTTDGYPVTDVIKNVHYCTPLANGVTLPIRYENQFRDRCSGHG